MERNDYFKIASILAFGMIIAAYLMNAGSIKAMNDFTESCNRKLELASRNYALCQACLDGVDVSEILKEVEMNGTEEEESS